MIFHPQHEQFTVIKGIANAIGRRMEQDGISTVKIHRLEYLRQRHATKFLQQFRNDPLRNRADEFPSFGTLVPFAVFVHQEIVVGIGVAQFLFELLHKEGWNPSLWIPHGRNHEAFFGWMLLSHILNGLFTLLYVVCPQDNVVVRTRINAHVFFVFFFSVFAGAFEGFFKRCRERSGAAFGRVENYNQIAFFSLAHGFSESQITTSHHGQSSIHNIIINVVIVVIVGTFVIIGTCR
mmetsp:Transcript_7855/g.12102  ORF Transcript_7855/g.12102 Transcript_7855/m.12102 type:complete len:236 (+) Transcript_7855:356-1063(+)